MRPTHWDRLALILALAAIGLGLGVAVEIFEAIPHVEDEFANMWQAQVMAEGAIYRPSPRYPKSFLVPFVVDFQGRRFGKYPPGWPALLSLGVRAGAARWVNPLLGGLAVWLTYRLGARLLDRKLALVAAALVTLSPMVLMLSGSLMAHNMGLVLALAFLLAWLDLFVRAGRSSVPDGLLVAVAGGSLGLLALTRPLTAIGLAAPFALHGVYLFLRRGESRRRLLAVIGLAGALCLLLPLWQYALTGDALRNPYMLWWEYDRIGFGPGIGVMEGGHSPRLALTNTKFSLRVGMHDLFGWPYLSWLFLPFGLIPMLRKPGGRLALAVFPSIVLAYAAYWIGAWLFGPRYYYEALPGLAIASAAGVGWLAGWQVARRQSILRPLAVTSLLASLIAVNAAFYLPARVGGMRGLYGIERAPIRTLAGTDLEGSLIIVRADHWTGYANLLPLAAPFSDDDILVAWSRGDSIDSRVVKAYEGYRTYFHDPRRPAVLLPASD